MLTMQVRVWDRDHFINASNCAPKLAICTSSSEEAYHRTTQVRVQVLYSAPAHRYPSYSQVTRHRTTQMLEDSLVTWI